LGDPPDTDCSCTYINPERQFEVGKYFYKLVQKILWDFNITDFNILI